MRQSIDVAVVTQDPWFGGGARRQLEAFCAATRELRREPEPLFLSRGTDGGYRSIVPRVDSLNQLLGVRIAARLRCARSVWVVAAAAHYGLAAAGSGRRYGCWVGTSLSDERRGRLAGGLPRSRALAIRANAPVLDRVERLVLRRAARVYATSSASRDAVAEAAALDHDRVGVLPLPVDLERFRPEPDADWLARLDAPTIAFVGRGDDPRKNIPLLLGAVPALRARFPGLRAVLAGRPPRTPLPAGVEAAGEVASVAELLRQATLFVLPSYQEGFGIAVAEALASGVPAVVTPSGGPEELVRESRAGVVLTAFDVDELVATVTSLLADRDRLVELRGRGRAYVERAHSPARLRELLAAAFAELDG